MWHVISFLLGLNWNMSKPYNCPNLKSYNLIYYYVLNGIVMYVIVSYSQGLFNNEIVVQSLKEWTRYKLSQKSKLGVSIIANKIYSD